jgi:hypothetical protein
MLFNFSSNDSLSLHQTAYECGLKLPTNGSLDGYSSLTNCTCAYCDNACEAPKVDGSIGFFDGFDGGLVLGVYFYLIIFSIVF